MVPPATPSCSKQNSDFNLSNLSQDDIKNLRCWLGIDNSDKENLDSVDLSGKGIKNLPRMTVEIDSADISDGESPLHEVDRNQISQHDMTNALFEEGEILEDAEWDLPCLKAPLKGKAVPQSLANMINLSCTSLCDTDAMFSQYKVPENCDRMCGPLVNNEIWKVMDKRPLTQDRAMADIQNLVATGMTPLVQLADVFKTQFSSNPEAKSLLGDALTIMGQVQYHLSVRRRYMIRPVLKRKYHSLCNISMPISSMLFGNDIGKDIKTCDSLVAIGKEPFYRGASGRGRGNGRFQKRGNYGYNANSYNSGYNSNYNSGNQRYQPYSKRGQQRGYRGNRYAKKSTSATVTSPNE